MCVCVCVCSVSVCVGREGGHQHTCSSKCKCEWNCVCVCAYLCISEKIQCTFFFQSLRVMDGGPHFQMGSACLHKIKCLDCGKLSTEMTSKKTGVVHTGFDINQRVLAAASASGMRFQQTNASFLCFVFLRPWMKQHGTSWRSECQGCHWTFAKIIENLHVRAVSQKMNTKRDRKRKMK